MASGSKLGAAQSGSAELGADNDPLLDCRGSGLSVPPPTSFVIFKPYENTKKQFEAMFGTLGPILDMTRPPGNQKITSCEWQIE